MLVNQSVVTMYISCKFIFKRPHFSIVYVITKLQIKGIIWILFHPKPISGEDGMVLLIIVIIIAIIIIITRNQS